MSSKLELPSAENRARELFMLSDEVQRCHNRLEYDRSLDSMEREAIKNHLKQLETEKSTLEKYCDHE